MIENLGEPFLGKTAIPEGERKAWPSRYLTKPKRVEVEAETSVINEFYFRRSTAFARAKELLGADVVYMVFYIGVTPNPAFQPPGGGIVVMDGNRGEDTAGFGLYHDFCNGHLVVEHTRDAHAKVTVTEAPGLKKKIVEVVSHFHVAQYGKKREGDEYSSLDLNKPWLEVVNADSAASYTSQLDLLRSFGKGSRQYLPTYWHTRRRVEELKNLDPSKLREKTFLGLRVPQGLPQRRSYDYKDGLAKHHIYYLNYPGSPYEIQDPVWY